MKIFFISFVLLWTLSTIEAFRQIKIPRLTIEEYERASRQLKEGGMPFILSGIGYAWRALHELTPEYLAREFGESIVDYYPENLLLPMHKPFLIPMKEALREMSNFTRPQYAHWRMTLDEAMRFTELVKPLPAMFRNDWESECFPAKDTRDNFRRVTAWQMLVMGNHGGGMFQHWDSFHTGTWQAQLVGTKTWTLCHPQDADLFPGAGTVNSFDPDYDVFPDVKQARCARFDAKAGDLVYYPSNWWHETRNVGFPCIGMAGRIVTRFNYEDVYDSLMERCKNPGQDISKIWKGAAPNPQNSTCRGLQHCLRIWAATWSQQEPYSYGNAQDSTKEIDTNEWKTHDEELCQIEPQKRLDCHVQTQSACLDAGCCWQPSSVRCGQRDCPACFAPQG